MTDKSNKSSALKSLLETKGMGELLVLLLGAILLFSIKGITTRFDLTEGERYSLSDQAKKIAGNIDRPMIVHLYLGGDLPPEFARLRTETEMLLAQVQRQSSSISVEVHNPWSEDEALLHQAAALNERNMSPVPLSQQNEGKSERAFVFPWAEIAYEGKNPLAVSLLKTQLGASQQERINVSVQELEYQLIDAMGKLSQTQKARVGLIFGKGSLSELEIGDFINEMKAYYELGSIELNSDSLDMGKLQKDLALFDLLVFSKPTQAFTPSEKYVLDQYMMNGGKSLWLVDPARMELDSIFKRPESGTIALENQLNLNDFFFRYGLRLNPELLQDITITPIVLQLGRESVQRPLLYNPMAVSKNNHPINKNVNPSRLQFAGTLDTLPGPTEKTILLESTEYAKTTAVLEPITIEDAINFNPEAFPQNRAYPVAVLVEGQLNSLYSTGRLIAPGVKKFQNHLNSSKPTALAVIADGDLIRNQLAPEGRIFPLGYDRWTNRTYGNKEFLLNTVNYLLGDQQVLALRNKEVSIPLLDQAKVEEKGGYWQWMHTLLPLALLAIGAFGFLTWRKRVY